MDNNAANNKPFITITFDENGNSDVTLSQNIKSQHVSVAACHLMGLASHSIQGCSKIGKTDSDED